VILYIVHVKFHKSTSTGCWVIKSCQNIQNGGCPPSWIIMCTNLLLLLLIISISY